MPQALVVPLIMMAISIAIQLAMTLLTARPQPKPQQNDTAIPKAADGKYNLKQNVPSLTVVLGTVMKGGDYAFLEERQGAAHHVTVFASHQIEGFVQHYFHDEAVTVNELNQVTEPAHFAPGGTIYAGIETRLGLPLETAFSGLVSAFPDIWSINHRGDGLAQVYMGLSSPNQEDYMDIFPQQSPLHKAVVSGALLYDPRTETTAFSRNLALMRLFHLTHPSGGKLSLSDLYMPDWINAADVSDENLLNRNGDTVKRYHGGLWYKYENEPVDIGALMDQAAELVIYERSDGTIGVHAGQMVTPDVRLVAGDIISLRYDANQRAASTVLAVRGRFTDPTNVYNTVDAAIFGNPYLPDDDTQRTKTVDVQAVQDHNHCQRLQKLAFIRANAPRVSITVHYDPYGPVRFLSDRRFVRVHYPRRGLDEAIVEITGRPKLSLAQLTWSFDGIVVPETLYAFDPETEEGVPSGAVTTLTPEGVPLPVNFSIGVNAEVISGGQPACFGVASWDHYSDALIYELEHQLLDESQPPQSSFSKKGETSVRSGYLTDLAEYRFRMRTWSNGSSSDWTSYETETAIADAVAPGQPSGFGSSRSGSNVTLSWTNPNSVNLFKTEVYRSGSSSFGSAVLIHTSNGGIGEARTYADNALASGTYFWWLKSLNASDIGSAEVGPQTKTIP